MPQAVLLQSARLAVRTSMQQCSALCQLKCSLGSMPRRAHRSMRSGCWTSAFSTPAASRSVQWCLPSLGLVDTSWKTLRVASRAAPHKQVARNFPPLGCCACPYLDVPRLPHETNRRDSTNKIERDDFESALSSADIDAMCA